MALADSTTIKDRIRAGIDIDYLDQLYRKQCYAFGEPWNPDSNAGYVTRAGEWPDYPDIVVRTLEVGASRTIMNNQFIGFSKSVASEPKPTFPELDPVTEKVRAQYFLKRWKGTGRYASRWNIQTNQTVWDGRALGIGFTKILPRTNPTTGKQYASIKHYPVWHVVYDPIATNPYEARWICFLNYYDPADALEIFGAGADDKKVSIYQESTGLTIEVVKVYEYYDIGIGGKDPMMAVYVGDLQSEHKRVKSPYPFLPVAIYSHLIVPKFRHPVGRIELQMADQEARNQIERYMHYFLSQYPVDIIDAENLDENDVKLHRAGRPTPIKMMGKPDHNVWQRIAAEEPPQSILQYMGIIDKDLTTSSGITDADRGNLNPTQRTATENQLIDQRSQTQSGWDLMQTTLYFTDLVQKVVAVGAIFDTDPVSLDIDGQMIPFNNPAQPASFLQHFLKDESMCLVDVQELDAGEAKAEKAQKLQLYNQLIPFAEQGLINPTVLVEKILKAIGERDPDQWLTDQAKSQAPQPAASPVDPQAQMQQQQQQQQMIMQAAQMFLQHQQKSQGKPPLEMINYKDAPPSIQAQMEQQAGFNPAPHNERQPKGQPPQAPNP
jgi:hypothetical protein